MMRLVANRSGDTSTAGSCLLDDPVLTLLSISDETSAGHSVSPFLSQITYPIIPTRGAT